MFCAFLTTLAVSQAKRPVILIPGLMGSRLNGDITDHKHWYCSKESDNNIWFNDKFAIPPLYNCLFDYIRLEWDSEKKEPKQPDYVNISIVDFGGIEGITTVDTIFFDKHIVPYYKVMIDKLEAQGYIVGQNLFGAPFDWRFGVYQTEAVWNDFIHLVERAYEQTQTKVVLVGHSMGGFLLNILLTEKTTKEWREKYVDSGLYIAPSFGGSGWGFTTLWSKKFPFLEILGEYPETVSTMGGIHVHMQNEEIWGDKVVSIGENGENLTAKDLTKYLLDNNKLDENSYNIFSKNEPYFKKAPQEPDVPTALVYNSGLLNIIGMNLKNGANIPIYGSGDLMVNEEGPKYVCSKWKNIKCLDIDSINPLDNHLMMLYQDVVNDFVIDWLNRE